MERKQSTDVEMTSVNVNTEIDKQTSVKIDEAVDMYGDTQTAQRYGYVNRGWVESC